MGEVLKFPVRLQEDFSLLGLAAGAEQLNKWNSSTLSLLTFEKVAEPLVNIVPVESLRTPESEMYGRSLSTIHRFGAFMLNKSVDVILSSPEAAQPRVEFYTSVEEGFGTDMELGIGLEGRDFDTRSVIDGKVMAKDLKTSISSMTEAGLKCALKTVNEDIRFAPQLTRSKWDNKNALIVDAMAQGETDYNTRIVVSPYPEEAAAQTGDEFWRGIGYVPHLKRGFVQLYYYADSEVVSGSLSFNGSNKQKLREIFSKHNVEIPEEEITDNWLAYAITGTLSKEEAKALATLIADEAGDPRYEKATNTVDVTSKHRQIMDKVFNDSYIHICESLYLGYQTKNVSKLIEQLAANTTHLNKRYTAALGRMKVMKDKFTDDDSVVLHELLVYSTIEMIRALYTEKSNISAPKSLKNYDAINISNLHTMDSSLFQSLLSDFANLGAKNNRTYSACGLSISAGEDETGDEPQSAFGGVSSESRKSKLDDDCEFISKLCPKCGEKNVKTKVTKTHISGSCGCKVKKS